MNIDKTKVMTIGTTHQLKKINKCKIKLEGKVLDHVNTYKYLGITLDAKLNFATHIDILHRCATYKVWLLNKIRKFIDADTALEIYRSKILPALEYGNVLYASASSKDKLQKLQTLQNYVLKKSLKLPHLTHTNQVHKTAKINYLEDRRNNDQLKLMFQRSKIEDYKDLKDLQTKSHLGPRLKVPIFKLSLTQNTFSYQGPIHWNELHSDIRSLEKYDSFTLIQKLRLKKLLNT